VTAPTPEPVAVEANVDWDSMDLMLAQPASVAAALNAGALWGVTDVEGRHLWSKLAAALELALAPPVDAHDEGFPTERIRLVGLPNREAMVYPLGPDRRWLHRPDKHPRALCLQHPADDPALLWTWDDGLGRLLTRVRLHLLCEEVWRRTGSWPGVDLPHGGPPGGQPGPVSDPLLLKGMRTWARC
jgi:hypothetical protein